MTEPDDDLTCRELVELITGYVDGEMGAGDRARFERHLAECTGCTRMLEQFRATIETTGRLTEEQLGAEQRDAQRRVFRRWREGASSS